MKPASQPAGPCEPHLQFHLPCPLPRFPSQTDTATSDSNILSASCRNLHTQMHWMTRRPVDRHLQKDEAALQMVTAQRVKELWGETEPGSRSTQVTLPCHFTLECGGELSHLVVRVQESQCRVAAPAPRPVPWNSRSDRGVTLFHEGPWVKGRRSRSYRTARLAARPFQGLSSWLSQEHAVTTQGQHLQEQGWKSPRRLDRRPPKKKPKKQRFYPSNEM